MMILIKTAFSHNELYEKNINELGSLAFRHEQDTFVKKQSCLCLF